MRAKHQRTATRINFRKQDLVGSLQLVLPRLPNSYHKARPHSIPRLLLGHFHLQLLSGEEWIQLDGLLDDKHNLLALQPVHDLRMGLLHLSRVPAVQAHLEAPEITQEQVLRTLLHSVQRVLRQHLEHVWSFPCLQSADKSNPLRVSQNSIRSVPNQPLIRADTSMDSILVCSLHLGSYVVQTIWLAETFQKDSHLP